MFVPSSGVVGTDYKSCFDDISKIRCSPPLRIIFNSSVWFMPLIAHKRFVPLR